MQNPSRTQIPMSPTAGRAKSKSLPGTHHITETDRRKTKLVDEAVQRQQARTPDDPCGDEGDHLRQEQDCPRDRPEPPAATRWMTLAVTSPSATGTEQSRKALNRVSTSFGSLITRT